MHLQPPPPPKPTFQGRIRAAVTAAHEAKDQLVHPSSGADVIAAIQAGVDVIATLLLNRAHGTGSLAAEMKDRQDRPDSDVDLWESAMRHDRSQCRMD